MENLIETIWHFPEEAVFKKNFDFTSVRYKFLLISGPLQIANNALSMLSFRTANKLDKVEVEFILWYILNWYVAPIPQVTKGNK